MSIHEGGNYQDDIQGRLNSGAALQRGKPPTALERYRNLNSGHDDLVKQLREQHAREGERLYELRKLASECEDRQCEIAEAVKALTGEEFFEP